MVKEIPVDLFFDLETITPKIGAQVTAILEGLDPEEDNDDLSWLIATVGDQARELERIVEGMRGCVCSVNGNGAVKLPGLAKSTVNLQDTCAELERKLGLLDQVIVGLQAEAKINAMDEDDFEPSRFLMIEILDRARKISAAIESLMDETSQVSASPAGSRPVDAVAPQAPQARRPGPVPPSAEGKPKGGDARKSVAGLKKRSAHSDANGKGGRRASAAV